jgi:hypothetical protein
MVKRGSGGKGGRSKGGAERPSKASLKKASDVMRDPNASKAEKSLAAIVLGEARKK